MDGDDITQAALQYWGVPFATFYGISSILFFMTPRAGALFFLLLVLLPFAPLIVSAYREHAHLQQGAMFELVFILLYYPLLFLIPMIILFVLGGFSLDPVVTEVFQRLSGTH